MKRERKRDKERDKETEREREWFSWRRKAGVWNEV